MKWLSDTRIDHLRVLASQPDLTATKYTTRNAARPVRRRCLRSSRGGCRARTAGLANRCDPLPRVLTWTSIVRSPECSGTERAAYLCGAQWGWACSVSLDGYGAVRHKARTHRKTALQENQRVQTIEQDAGVGVRVLSSDCVRKRARWNAATISLKL